MSADTSGNINQPDHQADVAAARRMLDNQASEHCNCNEGEWHYARCRVIKSAVLEGRQIASGHWVYRAKKKNLEEES